LKGRIFPKNFVDETKNKDYKFFFHIWKLNILLIIIPWEANKQNRVNKFRLSLSKKLKSN
jgi:hypothetical protein